MQRLIILRIDPIRFKISKKYILGPPTIEYYFELGVGIDSEEL